MIHKHSKIPFFLAAILFFSACLPTSNALGMAEEIMLGFSMAPQYTNDFDVQNALDDAILTGSATFVARLTSVGLLDTVRDHLNLRMTTYALSSSIYEDGQTDVWVDFEVPAGMMALRLFRGTNSNDDNPRAAAVLDRANEILDIIITDDMSDLEREFAIHDYLTANVRYELDGDVADAYSAICLWQAKCSGYADAFYLLCSMAGLTVRKIPGMAGGEAHEWNVIELDGKWYFVDPTWDTPIGGDPNHVYLNIPASVLANTHSWHTRNEPGIMATELDENNYYIAKNLTANDADKLAQMALKSLRSGQRLEVLCPSFLNIEDTVSLAMQSVLARKGASKTKISYDTRPYGPWQCLIISFSLQ